VLELDAHYSRASDSDVETVANSKRLNPPTVDVTDSGSRSPLAAVNDKDRNSTETETENRENAYHGGDNGDNELQGDLPEGHIDGSREDSRYEVEEDLKISILNVNGWTATNEGLRKGIIDYLDSDIVCINETHFSNNKDKPANYLDKVEMLNFTWIGNNRKFMNEKAPKPSGGVGILVRNELFAKYNVKVVDKDYDGVMALLFENKETSYNFVTICAYLPPENSVWGRDAFSFYNHLLQLVYMYNDVDALFICGDLNSRVGTMTDHNVDLDCIPGRTPVDKTKNLHGEALIEFLLDAKMCLLNGRLCPEKDSYTVVNNRGRSVVDYVIVPHDVYPVCSNFEVLTCEEIIQEADLMHLLSDRCKIPDHAVLNVVFNMYKVESNPERPVNHVNANIEELPGKTCRRYNLKLVPSNFMTSQHCQTALVKVIEKLEQDIKNKADLDELYEAMCDALIKEMNNVIPFKDVSIGKERKWFKSHKPYWNEGLAKLWKEMVQCKKSFEKWKGNRQIKAERLLEFKEKRKLFDRHLRREERIYNRAKMLEIEELNVSNPNAFWEKIKNLGPRKVNKIPMEIYEENGNVNRDQDEVMGRWQQDFCTLFEGPNGNFDQEFYNTCQIDKMVYEESMKDDLYVENPRLNHEFSMKELESVISKCKNKKAVGVDLIPNEVLKNKNVVNLLLSLLNKCYTSNLIPGKWLQAIIYPIPKSSTNDKRIPLNYRGISLLSTISKIYTGLINKRLQDYLESENKLVDEQNGFRKGRSCQDHIFTLSSIIRNRKTCNLSTYAAFIDFRKAFDYVNRNLLLYRLLESNVDGHMYNAIKMLYQNTSACVQVNEHYTGWFPTLCGVRQGDNLSPTLFSLFLNSLAEELKALEKGVKIDNEDVCILLYADDIVLLSESEEKLQTLLNAVNDWCNKWQLVVNAEKSQIVHFRKKTVTKTIYDFKLGEIDMHVVERYKYLGVVLDEFLDFSEVVNSLAVGGGRALGSLNTKFKSVKNMGVDTYSKLFENCVMPVLHYSAGVWGLQSHNSLQNIQNRAMRFFLGTHKMTPTLGMFGDLGWYPLEIYRKIEAVRLWNRFIEMSNDRITKKVFQWDWNHCRNNWSAEVKNVLYDIEMEDYFDEMHICPIKDVSERLKGDFKHSWSDKAAVKVKLRTYIKFKSEFGVENYLKLNLDRSDRSFMAQLRLGILPLHVETGRFNRTPLAERICNLCRSNVVEDETHFVLHCQKYNRERDHLFRKAKESNDDFEQLTDVHKLRYLFTKLGRQTAKFIKEAYNKRFNVINVRN
jgi:exonuclease III